MTPLTWKIRERTLASGRRPLLMGIVNVTPDSFSDGGRFLSPQSAVERAQALVEQGADILDVGGESTRPGSEPVPLDEELRRVLPVFEALTGRIPVPLSVDTSKAQVARRALQCGAAIINDVTALRGDPEMVTVAAEFDAGLVAMHMQGRPATMQKNPSYTNVVEEVFSFFRERLAELARQGIDPSRVVVDPGIGFGKTLEHNLQLLHRVERFHDLGRPLCIGHSRKKILGSLTGQPVENRLYGGIGVALALVQKGVGILRVHDVAAVRDAVDLFLAVMTGHPQR
jgi:dihydropteroate synthase